MTNELKITLDSNCNGDAIRPYMDRGFKIFNVCNDFIIFFEEKDLPVIKGIIKSNRTSGVMTRYNNKTVNRITYRQGNVSVYHTLYEIIDNNDLLIAIGEIDVNDVEQC